MNSGIAAAKRVAAYLRLSQIAADPSRSSVGAHSRSRRPIDSLRQSRHDSVRQQRIAMKYWRPRRAAFLFTLALVAFVVAVRGFTIGDLDVFGVVLWALIGGWAAVVLIRSFQVAILATPTHVTIRNWLATKRVPWTEVAPVSPPLHTARFDPRVFASS